MSRSYAGIVVFILILFSLNSGNAETERLRNHQFGFRFGMFGAGSLELSSKNSDYTRDINTESDFTFGMHYRVQTGKAWATSLSLDFYNLKYSSFASGKLTNIGVGFLKTYRSKSGNYVISPEAVIGIGFVSSIPFVDNTKHLTLHLKFNADFNINKNLIFTNDIGLLWGLLGGNGSYDVTGGPFFIYRLGIAFSN